MKVYGMKFHVSSLYGANRFDKNPSFVVYFFRDYYN